LLAKVEELGASSSFPEITKEALLDLPATVAADNKRALRLCVGAPLDVRRISGLAAEGARLSDTAVRGLAGFERPLPIGSRGSALSNHRHDVLPFATS
jgi:hypothetical protein